MHSTDPETERRHEPGQVPAELLVHPLFYHLSLFLVTTKKATVEFAVAAHYSFPKLLPLVQKQKLD